MLWGVFSFTLLLTSQNTYWLHLWFIVYFPTILRKLTLGRNLAKVRAEVASWTGMLLSFYCILGNQNETKGSQQFFSVSSTNAFHISVMFSPAFSILQFHVKWSKIQRVTFEVYKCLENLIFRRSHLSVLKLSEVLPHAYFCLKCSPKDHQKKRNWSKVLESTIQNRTHIEVEQAFLNLIDISVCNIFFTTERNKICSLRKLWLDHDNGIQWQSIGKKLNTSFFPSLLKSSLQ